MSSNFRKYTKAITEPSLLEDWMADQHIAQIQSLGKEGYSEPVQGLARTHAHNMMRKALWNVSHTAGHRTPENFLSRHPKSVSKFNVIE